MGGESKALLTVGGRKIMDRLYGVLGGLFDLLENSASTLAMSLYPAKARIPLIAASVFTPIKWALVSASFIPYLLFGAAWLIQQGKNSKA